MKDEIKFYIKTSRPVITLMGPFLMACGFVYSHAEISVISIIEFLMLTIPYSLFLYGINDIYDYETDLINERKGGAEGAISKQQYHTKIKIISVIVVVILLLMSFLTLNWINIIAMCGLVCLSYFYSAPPLRVKEHPPFDSLFSAGIYFFFPFMLGTSFGVISVAVYLKVLLALLGTIAAHSFSTISDYTPDKQAGVITFAVKFGKRVAALTLVVAALGIYISQVFDTWLINFFALVSSIFGVIIFVYPNEKLAYYFLKVLYISFVIGVVVFVGYKIDAYYFNMVFLKIL